MNTPLPPPPPYHHGTDPRYAQHAAATFTLDDYGSALVLAGPCPRCGRPMDFTVVKELFRTTTTATDPAPTRAVVMYCTVETVYEGAPDGHTGCGAYWSLLLPTTHP